MPIRAACRLLCAAIFVLAACGRAAPARAFDFLARHEVTAQFATQGGKPMAHVPVRVFAPGQPQKPALVGRTDANGKFTFPTDRNGFWSAEAREKGEVARVMIRVGSGASAQHKTSFPPVLVIGGLAVLLVIAFWYRLLRTRSRRPRP